MFDKIQVILMMKTSISNNRISRLKYFENYEHVLCSVKCPIALQAKLIFKKICILKTGWYSEVPVETEKIGNYFQIS